MWKLRRMFIPTMLGYITSHEIFLLSSILDQGEKRFLLALVVSLLYDVNKYDPQIEGHFLQWVASHQI